MTMLHVKVSVVVLVLAVATDAYLQPVPSKPDRVGVPKDAAVIPESPFKAWPQAKVIANGDYTEEQWIEEHIGGPLYELQDKLPRLPIPTIAETVERLAPSCLPLAEGEDEIAAFQAALDKFPQQAQSLQERLLQRQAEAGANHSWLQKLWQTLGYLQVRDPVSPCVSYFLFVPDDDTLDPPNDVTPGVARAAAMLHSMAEGRLSMCSGQMPAESVSETQPLCSAGFKYLFHATRIPQLEQDCYHLYDPARYSHAIIARKGQFYAMEFVNPKTGEPLPLRVLQERLLAIQTLAATTDADLPQLGWLTACDRDTWAKARQELKDQGGEDMTIALETMESGAFVINLDDAEPTTMTEAANCFWTGGSLTPNAGANRWHDKCIQLACTKNGKVAWVGEHSMLDAAPVIPLIRRILKTTYKKLAKRPKVEDAEREHVDIEAGVSNIFANVWESQPDLVQTAAKLTTQAKAYHKQMADKYNMHVVMFEGYGKKMLKQAGFQGPEFVQLAMQLAAYRLFGKQVGTYEAALTRYFRHGRTGTARPVSPSSHAFLQAMGQQANGNDVSKENKLQLLRDAAAVFSETQQRASDGHGVDRHLFGLSCMVQDDEKVALFQDPVYQRGKQWKLSTSAVIFAPGFGPSHNDGVGVGFLVSGNACQFTCSTLSKNEGLLEEWAALLEEALTEMGALLQE